MSKASEPFFFSGMHGELFGIYHDPEVPMRGEAILLCYPAPQEMMRSQQAQVQLARELAGLGYPVLRFDYAGTGDSDGNIEKLNLSDWIADTCQAAGVLKKKSGLTRLLILGTRLGGTIALRASQELGARRLVLWDPIIDGLAYLEALGSTQRAMLSSDPLGAPRAHPRYRLPQSLGFHLSQGFCQELAGILPANLEAVSKQIHLLSSETSAAISDFATQLRAQRGPEIEVSEQLLGEPMHWLDARYIKRRAFPSRHLHAIKKLLEVA